MNTSSGDSFFTSFNHFDPQVEHFTAGNCESLIEASVRRMTKTNGPIHAAVRLQRLSDICAGVYVLPIEHWNRKLEPAGEPTPLLIKTRRQRWTEHAIRCRWPFLYGWLCCLLFMIAFDLARLAL